MIPTPSILAADSLLRSYDAFREAIAQAVGTTPDRVALHTLHQHEAPGSDLATERLLAEFGLGGEYSNANLDAQVMERVAAAAKESLKQAQPVTHFGLGFGKVEKVASNRRIVGPDDSLCNEAAEPRPNYNLMLKRGTTAHSIWHATVQGREST